MATNTPMQLGMVGLGRMGAGLVRRLMADGHRCVGYDVSADAVSAVAADPGKMAIVPATAVTPGTRALTVDGIDPFRGEGYAI